jgi:signal transduction histidine kinase
MNLIAIPAAIIILIGGFMVLRHLMSETRVALSNLAKSDQALQDLNQDLEQRVEQRTAELHEAQASLLHSERLAALAEVTGSISHELRNPVGALQNALSSIKRISSNEDRFMIKSVALADRSVKRINHVIEELLDYSRVRALQLTSVRLDDWLADLLEEYKPPQPVKLRRELGSDVMIDLDQKRLTLAITNLLDNASQAIVARNVDRAVGSRSEISVTTRLVDDSVEITIDDTGPGIAPDDLEKVFEPLFTTKSTAIGLGLVITRQIIDQHNGAITIESEQGHGARATVRLALGEPQQIAANTAA